MSKNVLTFVMSFFLTLGSYCHAEIIEEVIKWAPTAVNLINSISKMRESYATEPIPMQVNLENEFKKMAQRQEEWNRWNGLVSLITQEEKKVVLKYNTMSDKDLADMYFALQKSSQPFPSEWLMPSKYDSLTEYLRKEYAKGQLDKVMQENDQISKKVRQTTEDKPIDSFGGSINLSLDDRMNWWKKLRIERKQAMINLLKEKEKNFKFESIEEYELYRNYVLDQWDGYYGTNKNATQYGWKKYLNRQGKDYNIALKPKIENEKKLSDGKQEKITQKEINEIHRTTPNHWGNWGSAIK